MPLLRDASVPVPALRVLRPVPGPVVMCPACRDGRCEDCYGFGLACACCRTHQGDDDE